MTDDEHKSRFRFKYDFESYRLEDKWIPEYAIAYDEVFVRKVLRRAGFRVIEPIHYGSWCGRQRYLSTQDIIVIRNG